MGSCTFGTTIVGKFENAKDAYNAAVEDAIEQHGNDAYNGTISTTHGFRLITGGPKFGTKAFSKWENKMLKTETEKHEPCLVVEITGATLNKMKENRRLKGKKGIKGYYFFGWASE